MYFKLQSLKKIYLIAKAFHVICSFAFFYDSQKFNMTISQTPKNKNTLHKKFVTFFVQVTTVDEKKREVDWVGSFTKRNIK